MMHELGHALGLPHMTADKSEIMTSKIGASDKCSDEVVDEKLCDFTNYDFERFLWPYKPWEAHVRKELYYGPGTCWHRRGVGPYAQYEPGMCH